MQRTGVAWQWEAFEEMSYRYFNAPDIETVRAAFVFYYAATTNSEIPSEEDIAWAKTKLGID